MEQILSKKARVAKYGEVFTPQHIVEQMCDALPDEAFLPSTSFLEPCCGEGVFVLEILRRKFARCKTRVDYTAAIDSVWSMEIQPQHVETTIQAVTDLCEQMFAISKKERELIRERVILADSLKVMRLINWLNQRDLKQIPPSISIADKEWEIHGV